MRLLTRVTTSFSCSVSGCGAQPACPQPAKADAASPAYPLVNVNKRLPSGALRRIVCIGAAVGMSTFAGEPACAVYLSHPVLRQPVLIALPDFLAGSPADAEPARAISQVVTINLERSGRFVPIDQAAFVDKVTNIDVVPRFPDWRAIKTEALVTGRVTRLPDGRIKVEFRLWDVSGGTQLLGRQYFSTPDNYPRIANVISDAIYERLTGEKGNFDASTSPR